MEVTCSLKKFITSKDCFVVHQCRWDIRSGTLMDFIPFGTSAWHLHVCSNEHNWPCCGWESHLNTDRPLLVIWQKQSSLKVHLPAFSVRVVLMRGHSLNKDPHLWLPDIVFITQEQTSTEEDCEMRLKAIKWSFYKRIFSSLLLFFCKTTISKVKKELPPSTLGLGTSTEQWLQCL